MALAIWPRGRHHRSKNSIHVYGNKLPLSSLKHSPVLSGKENVGVNRGADGRKAGLTQVAGVSNLLLIPQLPSFPISAPDLRLEAEVPRPLSLL